MIPSLGANMIGVYRASLAQQTVVQNAHDGTTTGILWAYLPATATTKKIRLRRVLVTSQHSTALATPTAPRLSLQRATFTGTASGTAVTASKLDTVYGAPSFDLRTAVTGLTPVLVAGVGALALVGAVTAVGSYHPVTSYLFRSDAEDERLVLAAGEGVVVYQDTAGTASDTRKYNVDLVWDEIAV